ncbi:hypothetical protein DRE_04791 [Drechslerella stenobrocha 248]|uniref:Bromodomain associated domain-containing protein n=1 Tax=Drechslerella stenobrocha 248 TaxID=1043628 RepID=W7I1B5_9PEZI|nr:hypothetical protein DRE_04791 [Drechslerella stenobrocha 248]
MDTPEQFFFSLLRISTAQTLRHAGLAGSRPSVLDSFTDMTARYLTLLGATARTITESSNRTTSELSDVLSAMEHLGLLKPLTIYSRDQDDTRAIDNFINWAKSPEVEELRKLAGVVTVELDDEDLDAGDDIAAVPDTAAMAMINGSTLATSQNESSMAAKRPMVSASERSKEPETDIPIKRENVDDHLTPMMMMDIDGIPLSLEDATNIGMGNSGLNAGVSANGSAPRSTEPPPDAGEAAENAKVKVRLKQVDWFTALKLKEDAARFNGTMLGKQAEGKKIVVEGGDSVPVQLPTLLPTGAGRKQPNGN